MKIVRLTAIQKLETMGAPDPVLRAPDDVLIRMGAVGVCGSDIHYYVDGKIGSQVVEYPFAVGHEGAGTVEAVGPAVRRVKPGDRIAVEPAMSCGKCDQCLAGRPNTCRKMRFLGCPGQVEGCLSEFLVMPEACCFPIPDTMSLAQAALSEPLAIAVYAVRRAGDVRGARIGVLGCGPIGLGVLLAARAAGAAAMYATDLIPARIAAARTAGACWAGHAENEPVTAEVARLEPLMLDVVFECCGEQAALDQGIALLKPGGRLVVVGIPRTERVSFQVDVARRREVSVINVRRQAHCVQPTLDMMNSGRLDGDFMLTHRFPFARTAEAFDLVAGLRDGVIKAMIEF